MLGLIHPLLQEADEEGRGNVTGGARAGIKDLSDPQILCGALTVSLLSKETLSCLLKRKGYSMKIMRIEDCFHISFQL